MPPQQQGQHGQSQQGGMGGTKLAQQFQQVTWDQIREPGLYVDTQSGDLYRIPGEALSGSSPLMQKVSKSQQTLLKIDAEPYLPVSQARALCADADIHPNF